MAPDPIQYEVIAVGLMLVAVIILAAFGVRPARRFIYSRFHGSDLYVVLTVDGKQVE
jgi:hypothetical protein